MRLVDVARRVAPRARAEYLAALDAGDGLLIEYGVTTPLRRAHLLAQTLHESGALTILREDMRYRAPRIMEIFGVGRHSAAITEVEAKRLAGDPEALAERVYGLGNPRKARELGNTTGPSGNYPGDGWLYRGNGLLQTTGRGAHRELGHAVGIGDLFERDPDQVTAAAYALLPALAEWRAGGCNAMADRNDIRSITRKINGGYNGLADRTAWFNKVWPLLRDDTSPKESWKAAEADPEVRAVQADLSGLGYQIKVDGRMGPATTQAVADFQARNGLVADGAPGPVTQAAIDARLSGAPAPAVPPPNAPPAGAAPLVGGAAAGGAAKSLSDVAPAIQDQVAQLAPQADAIPALKVVVAILALIAAGLALYGLARQLAPGLFHRKVEALR